MTSLTNGFEWKQHIALSLGVQHVSPYSTLAPQGPGRCCWPAAKGHLVEGPVNHYPADFSHWCRCSSTAVCLQQCRSVSFVVFLLYFHTLLHQLVIAPLQYSPSIFCSVIFLIFSRLDVHFWSVCWLSFITHAQAILIASVCSDWTLVTADWSFRLWCCLYMQFAYSEPAIFTGIKPFLHEFGETSSLTSVCEYWDNI